MMIVKRWQYLNAQRNLYNFMGFAADLFFSKLDRLGY